MQQKSFVIEGNIGAGKSTFLKILSSYFNAQFVYEPHQKWQNVGGHNILDWFYKDPKRWSYAFQTYAFITRIIEIEEHSRINNQALQIIERSIYSDRYCFAKNAFELGMMNELEWNLYQQWFGWLENQYTTKPSGFIYLRTDPEVCYERIGKRKRHEEEGVSLDYLQQLHHKHESWLVDRIGVVEELAHVPVLVLECNEEFENNSEIQRGHMLKIASFLEETYAIPVSVSLASTVLL